jgi:glycerol-3-phosphate dehydrogenase subunit C
MIPGLQIIESQAACCGIAGTYGYKSEKYQIGMDVGEALFSFANEIGGGVVICDSETCRWQITHGTGIPAVHPVELLAYSYGHRAEGALARELQRITAP